MSNHSLLTLCVACVLATAGITAHSEVNIEPNVAQRRSSVDETLRNIPAAGGACFKDDFAPKPTDMARAPARKTDPDCAITLEQLSASLQQPDTVLVDVRAKAAFDTMRINGAINMQAAEIRTKRYLSNKTIVLLGDGKAEQDLYALCGELKSAGFKQAKVLRGGVMAWILDNKAVIGSAPNLPDLVSLSPGELFQESKVADNLVIGVSSGRNLADVLPLAGSLPSANVEAVKTFIQKRKKAKGPGNIILVADARFDHSQLAALAQAVKPEPLLVYTGSESEYRQFLRIQNAMWAKQAKGPVRPTCGAM
jgi:rhodanese-related sulfurtransferase